MIQNILKGYKSLFLSIGKITLLFTLCILLGLALVWPLWYLAEKAPYIYTICTAIAAVIFLAIFIYKSLKQTPFLTILFGFLQIIICLFGIGFCIFFVLHEKRIFGGLSLLFSFILFGIFRFGFRAK